jgi:hypothetical protein
MIAPARLAKGALTNCELAADGRVHHVVPATSQSNPAVGAEELPPLGTRPSHPSLEFKCVGKRASVYSVRVGIGWRALGVVDQGNDAII